MLISLISKDCLIVIIKPSDQNLYLSFIFYKFFFYMQIYLKYDYRLAEFSLIHVSFHALVSSK